MSTDRDQQWAQDDAGSAFGVTGDVVWGDTGWGDEDLSGSTPAPAAPVAPRPVEETAPAPVPEAPTPVLTADLEEPEWARVRPAETAPAPLAPPVTPLSPPPAAPTVTPGPTPQVAYRAPEFDAEYPEPVQPAAVPAAPAPVAHHAPPREPQPRAPYAPREDRDTFAGYDERTATTESAPVHEDREPYRAPAPRREEARTNETAPKEAGRGKRGKGRAKNERAPKSKNGPKGTSGAMAGGRWKAKAFRGVIYTLLLIFLIGGVRGAFFPKAGPSAEEIAASVRTSLGDTGFPAAAAEGFAIRFANTYLNFDPETREARTQALATYSQEAADGAWGWTGSDGAQRVTNGPFLAAKPVVKDKSNAFVTVAAQVDGGPWLYLSIPVFANERGALVVSGPPAFVSPPARAVAPGAPAQTASDDALVQTLTTDVLPGYFKAWAASNTVELERYITPDATPAASTGLTGAVTLGQIGEVQFPREPGGDTRVGEVAVTWTSKTAGSFIQSYAITVVKDPNGRWSVKDVVGGVVSPAGSGAEATPGPQETDQPTG